MRMTDTTTVTYQIVDIPADAASECRLTGKQAAVGSNGRVLGLYLGQMRNGLPLILDLDPTTRAALQDYLGQ